MMADEYGDSVAVAERRPRAALWVIAISLAVMAVGTVLRVDQPMVTRAFGQPVTHAGARGIFAFSGQLSARTYGLFMVDVDAGTVWCYEYLSSKQQLRLVAGRSWLNDKFLENYNCDKPSPSDVEEIVEQERTNKLRARSSRNP